MRRILSKRTLAEYAARHADAEDALEAWYNIAVKADWRTPQDVKATFKNASILPDNRVVFNVKGNHYRLIAYINYEFGALYVKWIGTHAEYDKIDAVKVGRDDH